MADILEDGIAIIGAGLGGTALALALHQKSIACRLYESRSAGSDVLSSGVVITPNGLKVLKELGLLEAITPQSYIFESNLWKNEKDETTQRITIASENSGYKYHRLYRAILLRAMKARLAELNVIINYDSKFEKVVSDTADGVKFQINGKIEQAAMLVGSDGIHSSVRSYLTSTLPEYTGTLCLYGHIPTSSVNWPDDDFTKACTIQGRPGSLFMVPEVADGSDMMVGTQFSYPEQDHKGWDALMANKKQLVDLFHKDYDQWHDTAKHVINAACQYSERLLVWPFYKMPHMDSWASATGRVAIMGDAAHAMPASSGQGVNQAFEDAFTLALLLSRINEQEKLAGALRDWHAWRQTKIDKAFELAKMMNMKRLAKAERQKLAPQQPSEDSLGWLFDLNLDELDAIITKVTQ